MNGENIDIKYIGIPNICFSLTDKEDEREVEFSKQRKERGFDESETWSLTDTICHFIIPRLKEFKEVRFDYPPSLTPERWETILDKMVDAFELSCRDEGTRIYNDEETARIDEGLDLFRQYFFDLWW